MYMYTYSIAHKVVGKKFGKFSEFGAVRHKF